MRIYSQHVKTLDPRAGKTLGAPDSSLPVRTAGAESARKLLGVLLAYDESTPAWTVPALAERLSVPLSSVYRYVALLREVGLLAASSDGDGTYRLTDRVIGLARAASVDAAALSEVAHQALVSLRDRVGETTLLIRRSGNFAYCIDRVESTHPVRLQFDIGAGMALHSGSASRVLLSSLSRQERRAYLNDVAEQITDEQRLLVDDAALDAVSSAGWAESFEEVDKGIWGVAAAVRDHTGVVAALATAGPLYRLPDTTRSTIIRDVRQAAKTVGEMLDARNS